MTIHQIVALAAVTLFYAVYLQRQFALRRRGIRTDRLGKGQKERRTRVLEIVLLAVSFSMPVAQYGSILAGWGWGLGWGCVAAPAEASATTPAWPGCAGVSGWLSCTPTPAWLGWAGVGVALAGVVFFVLAVVAMRDNWRAGIDAEQKTELVTRGVYRLSRNPAFVGFDLLYVGVALAFPNLVLIALTAVGVVVFHLQILAEERFMEATFGMAYAQYAAKTRRYL